MLYYLKALSWGKRAYPLAVPNIYLSQIHRICNVTCHNGYQFKGGKTSEIFECTWKGVTWKPDFNNGCTDEELAEFGNKITFCIQMNFFIN